MSIKYPFITNLVLGKVEKENRIRKFQKSEERKVKDIGNNSSYFYMKKWTFKVMCEVFLSSEARDKKEAT